MAGSGQREEGDGPGSCDNPCMHTCMCTPACNHLHSIYTQTIPVLTCAGARTNIGACTCAHGVPSDITDGLTEKLTDI